DLLLQGGDVGQGGGLGEQRLQGGEVGLRGGEARVEVDDGVGVVDAREVDRGRGEVGGQAFEQARHAGGRDGEGHLAAHDLPLRVGRRLRADHVAVERGTVGDDGVKRRQEAAGWNGVGGCHRAGDGRSRGPHPDVALGGVGAERRRGPARGAGAPAGRPSRAQRTATGRPRVGARGYSGGNRRLAAGGRATLNRGR